MPCINASMLALIHARVTARCVRLTISPRGLTQWVVVTSHATRGFEQVQADTKTEMDLKNKALRKIATHKVRCSVPMSLALDMKAVARLHMR